MREAAIIGAGMPCFGKFAGRGSLSLAEKALGGRVPANMGGGSLRKSHPIGAAGSGRFDEPTHVRAGKRQVALMGNGGVYLGKDAAAEAVKVSSK